MQVASYRPISLFPILLKVFEKLLTFKFLSFLKSRNVISHYQLGFREKYGENNKVGSSYHFGNKASFQPKKILQRMCQCCLQGDHYESSPC